MAEPNAYGGFWIRLLAYIVDSLIVGIAFFLIVMLLTLMGLELISPMVIYFVLFLLYWSLMQSSARQATYGKSLVGLKVTGYGGERITLPRALAREAAKILSTMTLLIGFVIAAFTTRKQALHDFMASTYVVRESPGHVVAAAAVALVALFAPVIVVMLFGAGMFAAVMGGMAAGMMGMTPEVIVQVPKPQAPTPTPPKVAAPQPAPQTVQAPAPAPKPAPVLVAAPTPMAQAPEPAKPAPAKEPPKPVAKKPAKEQAPKPVALPREAPAPQPPTPPSAAAPVFAPPPVRELRFNDLITAVLYRDAGAVNDLLAFGKWPDKADSQGMTPLMLAAMLGDAASAEALLKAGANPNRSGPSGDTAMSLARERKHAPMQALLQRYGAR